MSARELLFLLKQYGYREKILYPFNHPHHLLHRHGSEASLYPMYPFRFGGVDLVGLKPFLDFIGILETKYDKLETLETSQP
jgi:hypothetical protein